MRDVVLQTIAKLIIPFIQLYGLYIIVYGHVSPGGGFAGGTILASSFILYALAYDVGEGFRRMPRIVAKWLESLGGLMFVALGLLALIQGGNYLTNILGKGTPGTLLSGGLIPLLTMAVGIKVASTIVTLFYNLLEETRHG